MRVRKKPVIVEAMHFTTDNLQEVSNWCSGLIVGNGTYMQIMTLEGVMSARIGDYIIKGVHGEFYPCAPGIFNETYEIIDE
jgi:hypothetical protein